MQGAIRNIMVIYGIQIRHRNGYNSQKLLNRIIAGVWKLSGGQLTKLWLLC